MTNKKIEFDLGDLNITSVCLDDTDKKNPGVFISGSFQDTDKLSYIYYFTYSVLPDREVKKTSKLFEYWEFTPSEKINSMVKSTKENKIYLASSYLSSINLADKDLQTEEVDECEYIKPKLLTEKNLLLGISNFTAIKMFDINKPEDSYFIYPGKKNLINDYIVENNKIVLCSNDHKLGFYDMRDKKSKFSIRHSFEFDMISWCSSSKNEFCAYSEEEETVYVFDFRKLNHYREILKSEINLKQIEYSDKSKCLILLEDMSDRLTIFDSQQVERVFESKEEINKFSLSTTEDNIAIIQSKCKVEILKNK